MSENRTVETAGTDIEEAIQAGLDELQVSRASVVVEILEEPSRGLFGLGAKQARFRLTTAARPRSEIEKVAGKTVEEELPEPETLPPPRLLAEEEAGQDALTGKKVLTSLLEKMSIEAEIVIEKAPIEEDDDNTAILQVRGSHLRELIGRKGEHIDSLQYLARLIASRELQHRARFVVDVDNYKSRRARILHNLAHRMANQAIRRRRTVKLEPMPAHERRIIHMALRPRTDVTTRSIGEGRTRKVTIVPKKGGSNNADGDASP